MKDSTIILALSNYFELSTVVTQKDLSKSNIHIYTESQESTLKYIQNGFSSCFCDITASGNIETSIQNIMKSSNSSLVLINMVSLNLETYLNKLDTTKWNKLVFSSLTLPFILMKEFVSAKKDNKVCHIFNIACINSDFKTNPFSNIFYNGLRSLTYCVKEEIRDLNVPVTFLQSNMVSGEVNFHEIFDAVEFCLSNSNRCTIDQVLVN